MSNVEPTSTTSQSQASSSFTTGASASTSSSSARSEIEAACARFVDAFRAGDATGVAACYTRDAQLLPANSDVVSGREAIAEFWRGAMSAGIASVRLDTTEVDGQGDLAVEVGRYALGGADGATLDRGKYMVLWRREGGALKLHRDIWTTSQPAPTAGA